MRLLLILPLLTACAHTPAELTAVKNSVDSKLEYVYYTYKNRPAGLKPNQTNCLGFSEAYVKEARVTGLPAVEFPCRTPSGQAHKAVQVGNWVLDNRYSYVVAFDEYDCKPIDIRTNEKKK